jgi:hypothetical protein
MPKHIATAHNASKILFKLTEFYVWQAMNRASKIEEKKVFLLLFPLLSNE